MFTYELARRIEGTGVTATVLHPGVARTNFGAEDQATFFKVMQPLARPFMRTPAAGAATSVYLASSLEVEGVTGRYFATRKPRTSNTDSYDTAVAARLWKVSTQLVGLTAAPGPSRPEPMGADGRRVYVTDDRRYPPFSVTHL